jgi:RNase H-fold protein (predicted Holliday junction resolvase)
MGRILGLDVSTKTIGMALFEENGKLLELTHITPKIKPQPENKLEELFRKVDAFEKLLTRYMELDIEHVVIEEPLLNSNNVYTVGTLLRFNGMISKVVDDVLGVIPEFISSYDSRSKELVGKKPVLFGAYPWDVDKKQIIWDLVADREPQIVWEYDKNMRLKKENFDMTDSYSCGLAWLKMNGHVK